MSDIFPNGMTNVTFAECNLDNVFVPPGNTVEESSCNRQLKLQNDGEQWFLDAQLKPKEPVEKEWFLEKGFSIDSKDIPLTKTPRRID